MAKHPEPRNSGMRMASTMTLAASPAPTPNSSIQEITSNLDQYCYQLNNIVSRLISLSDQVSGPGPVTIDGDVGTNDDCLRAATTRLGGTIDRLSVVVSRLDNRDR